MKVMLKVLGEAPPGLGEGVLARLPEPITGGEVIREELTVASCYDRQRAQVDAARLLETVAPPAPGWAAIAMTGADLFLPPLAYVFGLSELGSCRGVVSWARLRPESAGSGAAATLTRRLSVEVVHELGHGLGLLHCVVPECAMHRSLWAEAVDLKKAEYCPTCLASLCEAIGAYRCGTAG